MRVLRFHTCYPGLSRVNQSTMLFNILVYLGVLAGVSYLALIFPRLRQEWKLYSHRSQLPPGPKIIKTGIRKPWLWFQELSREYGDVVYLQMGPTPTVVLGSAQAAWDLLEKKGSIFSSRPRFIMGGELLSGGMRGLMASYSPFWRRWRKLLHSGFMQRQSETYRPVQSLESKVLMHELLTTPRDFRRHLERYAASVIVTVTYGRRVEGIATDIVVQRNAESMGRLTSVNIPGKFAVERYPILKYVPSFLATWKAEVLKQRQKDVQMYTELMDEVRDKVSRGVAPESFAKHLLQEQTNLGMSDLEIAYTAGSPFGAGVETSAGSLASFFLACAKFGPQFIPRAQEELDRVVGSDRLPTFEDLNRLEYVRAIASETLRWRPVAVLGGTPHASTADHIYKGMFIPKGSTVIAPLWSIHLNEADFPEPHEFRPERFLTDREYPGTFGHSAFGWGRRICPGMHLGSASVALNIARTLWGFEINPEKDEKRRDIDVDIFAYSDGFNSSPLPFPCSITPRSLRHAQVIEREYAEALKALRKYAVVGSKLS
ncbi:cytochrome P450 [Colletotrichum godetiae]|uniref:Cytochrome P450 n=1 Tax=Colletotrichum godetiae TaxID=1209918 RepID=A0AAJ0AQQ5_9PEZI|nr:cytochrome P450 [Colletotrichum godetiae]KAK1676787.1 cytochrome P450 [Colletotrichum godetiae]